VVSSAPCRGPARHASNDRTARPLNPILTFSF